MNHDDDFRQTDEEEDRNDQPGLLDPSLPLAIRVLRVVAIVIAVIAGLASATAAVGLVVLFIMCSGAL